MSDQLIEAGKIPQERAEFWDILGGVRFALAMIVIGCHLPAWTTEGLFFKHLNYLSGPTAVICFLVISGFSIAASLERDSRRFYQRRILRIYPLYLFSLVISLLVARSVHAVDSLHLHHVMANFFFLQTFGATPLSINAVVWTLALEVGCYFAAPLFHELSTVHLLMIAGISAAGFAAFPWLHLNYYAYLPTFGAMFFLCWAWLAGFIYYRHRHNSNAGMGLLAIMILLTTFNQEFTMPWQHITIAGSILAMVTCKQITLKPVVRKVLAFLGGLSFPLYLIHIPVCRFLHDRTTVHSEWIYVSAALGASVIAMMVDAALRGPSSIVLKWIELFGQQTLAVARVATERVAIGLYAIPLSRTISVGLTLGGLVYAAKSHPQSSRIAASSDWSLVTPQPADR